MDRTTVMLREYLDVQFNSQNRLLADISRQLEQAGTRLARLGDSHNALDRRVTEHRLRLNALEKEADAAKDFRRRAIFLGVPMGIGFITYLVTEVLATFVRHGPHLTP